MEKTVTRDQMNTILEGRPKGVSGKEIIDTYIANGYKVEGINYTPEQSFGQKAKDVAIGFGKGAVKTVADTARSRGATVHAGMIATRHRNNPHMATENLALGGLAGDLFIVSTAACLRNCTHKCKRTSILNLT